MSLPTFSESPRFPDEIAAWAVGGAANWLTTVVRTYGGDEYRTGAWSQSLGEWEIANAWRRDASAPTSQYRVTLLRDFMRVNMGQLGGFRFKDFTDYADEGHGIFVLLTATTFQMYKRYTLGSQNFDRIITKPVSASVVVTGGAGPTVDYTTGIVTVASGTPTSWTGQFDVPVRFAEDTMRMGLEEATGALYVWQTLRLVEIRNP